jgi:nitroreductase
MDLLNKHKTIRNYKDAPVSAELLNSILNSGCRASTTGNMQLYSIIVTKDPAIKEQLHPLHFNQPVAKSSPVLLTICADFNRFTKWCNLSDAKPGYDNFMSFLTASIDALLLAQNICIAAEDKGLGICYLGTSTYNAKEIIDVLKLPELVFPITTLAMGWPNENPEQTDRLPLEAIVHDEVYHDYDNGAIQELYSVKENLLESKKFINENKKETLAQVFTDVRYKKADNEFFSKKVLEVLKEQRFL